VLVRVEVFRGLGRMRADREDLPVLAREIRNRTPGHDSAR